jgi:hypothetical protein
VVPKKDFSRTFLVLLVGAIVLIVKQLELWQEFDGCAQILRQWHWRERWRARRQTRDFPFRWALDDHSLLPFGRSFPWERMVATAGLEQPAAKPWMLDCDARNFVSASRVDKMSQLARRREASRDTPSPQSVQSDKHFD